MKRLAIATVVTTSMIGGCAGMQKMTPAERETRAARIEDGEAAAGPLANMIVPGSGVLLSAIALFAANKLREEQE